MALISGTKLGPYEIVPSLGVGGMGEVYRAKDTRLGRDVAIKILPANVSADPVAKQRFEREAMAISGLIHPNICVLHVGSQDGVNYLVMECVEGETLARRLEKGPLPLDLGGGRTSEIRHFPRPGKRPVCRRATMQRPPSRQRPVPGFAAANYKASINGYIFGNLPMPTMKKGEHVRWYVMTMGGQVNYHTPHWHGNVVTIDKHHTDIFSILPAQFVTADMVPDRVGTWMFHCHIDEHMEMGMMATYQVLP